MKTTRNIRSLRSQGFTLIELLVVISIIAILAGFALPVFSAAQKKGRIADSLSNMKQIATAMKMFATDNDGNFPINTTAGAALAPGVGSNGAFENLMPKYISTKKIFAVKTSFYCKGARVAAEVPNVTEYQLLIGHNDYDYMIGLSETSDARWPLACTGTVTATDTWASDNAIGGGVWSASDAIVVYCDCSVKSEPVNGGVSGVAAAAGGAYINRPDGTNLNILTPASPWMGASNGLMQPL